MSKSGVSEQNIVNQISSTRAVYNLSSTDLVKMQQNFVPDRVIATMQGTTAVVPGQRVYQAAPVTYIEQAPVVARPVGVSAGVYYRSR
jgi:hypothetical protein